MSIDLERLKTDLRAAAEASRIAAQGSDGGTSNTDTVYLFLPGAREQQVMDALQAAGIRGWKSEYLGKAAYYLVAPGAGQGESNTRAVRALHASLTANGWDASICYRMD